MLGGLITSTVNERFKKVRKTLGFNQKDFASELGISQTHISGIENGKDSASTSLLKLICVKFNISEEWLFNDIGFSEPGWDIDTDEGAISKYNAMRVSFERTLRTRKGENLTNTVEAFSFFTSLMSIPQKRLDEENLEKYLKHVCLVIDIFERLCFKTTQDFLVPSKNDAKGRIYFKNDCNEAVDNITKNIKQAVNVFLEKHGEEMKL